MIQKMIGTTDRITALVGPILDGQKFEIQTKSLIIETDNSKTNNISTVFRLGLSGSNLTRIHVG